MFLLSIEIVIFEDINGKSPFIGRNALLMAPMSEHQLNIKVTNAKTSYSITQGAELISISKLGKISSNDMLGTAVILVQATESDTGLVQELSLVVQVKTVSYMMLNSLPVIQEPKSTLKTVPLGLKLPIFVSFHDEYGVRFDAVNDNNGQQHAISTRPNRLVQLLSYQTLRDDFT